MSCVTIEDRVDRLDALFGQFLSEIAVINLHAEERSRLAEERMARFEQEMRASKRELHKKWGDLANKMGTILENIVAPILQRLAGDYFRLNPVLNFMIRRVRRRLDCLTVETEFDVLLVGAEAVIVGEAKSTPSIESADAFADKVRAFFDFFPEYRGRRLIPVFGSWAIAEPVIGRLTQQGIYALRMGEDTMELANAAQLDARP